MRIFHNHKLLTCLTLFAAGSGDRVVVPPDGAEGQGTERVPGEAWHPPAGGGRLVRTTERHEGSVDRRASGPGCYVAVLV